jgi:galactokinase
VQDLPDVDDDVGARCPGAGFGGNIFSSSFSPAAKINDSKVR